MTPPEDCVELGYISGVFGVRGWIKVFSFTERRENILNFTPWILSGEQGQAEYSVVDGGTRGQAVVARLTGVDDREDARLLIGSRVYIRRAALPVLAEDEYYWSDLVGLEVCTVSGIHLGRVESLMETGANDVLVVAGDEQRLIPYIRQQVVKEVDLAESRIVVDWDPEF